METGLVINLVVRDTNGEVVAELDFWSDEVKYRMINMLDEQTHHDLSVTGDRGVTNCITYHSPKYQRAVKRGVRLSRHMTGIYATNAGGKPLPPTYIFDSGAKI